MPEEFVHQRRYDYGDELYIARDRVLEDGRFHPEHAILIKDRLVWVPHAEGGIMDPLFVLDRT